MAVAEEQFYAGLAAEIEAAMDAVRRQVDADDGPAGTESDAWRFWLDHPELTYMQGMADAHLSR